MDAEYLLEEVRKFKKIEISDHLLNQISEFKTAIEIASMESLALVLGGHQPLRDYRFDIEKLKKWCKENSLIFYFNELNRTLHLEINNQRL